MDSRSFGEFAERPRSGSMECGRYFESEACARCRGVESTWMKPPLCLDDGRRRWRDRDQCPCRAHLVVKKGSKMRALVAASIAVAGVGDGDDHEVSALNRRNESAALP